MAPKCGKIARFPGGEKSVESCHVSGCHGFFGPDSMKESTRSLAVPLTEEYYLRLQVYIIRLILALHKLRISRVIPWESPPFPKSWRAHNCFKIMKTILREFFSSSSRGRGYGIWGLPSLTQLKMSPIIHRMLQGAAQRGAQFYLIFAVLQGEPPEALLELKISPKMLTTTTATTTIT